MEEKKEKVKEVIHRELLELAENECFYFLTTFFSNRVCTVSEWYLFKKRYKHYFQTVFEYKTKILKFTPEFFFENDIPCPEEQKDHPSRVLRSILKGALYLEWGLRREEIDSNSSFLKQKTQMFLDDFMKMPEDIEEGFVVSTLDRKAVLEMCGKCVVVPKICQTKGSKKVLSEFIGSKASLLLKAYFDHNEASLRSNFGMEKNLHPTPADPEHWHIDDRLYPGEETPMYGRLKNLMDSIHLEDPRYIPDGWVFGVYKGDYGKMDF